MSNGRFLSYYWDVVTILGETDWVQEITYRSSPDEADFQSTFEFRVLLTNSRQLIVRVALDSNSEIIEHRYYYCIETTAGERLRSYDDKAHHSHLPTHPHHMHIGPRPDEGLDLAHSSDIAPVNFRSVVQILADVYYR